MAAVKPVILLAFANDPADGINYLRNLPEEARRIRAALEYAEAQGLCEFEVRYNATLDDILAAFQQPKLRGRIAIFHYGGHADSYDLLFQSSPGDLQRIDARGFAAFLAEQRSLQLVFLNACTTEPQIDGLLAANVQVVIATSQEVDDGVAAELATRFYQELAHGATIGSSYRQAVAALQAQKGNDPAPYYVGGGLPPAGEDSEAGAAAPGVEVGGSTSGGFWPWMLRTRRGAEAAIEWSLPHAAGDPLFGLPALPPKPLPDSPYQRGLDYYTREMAELFFGRGRQIRELYQRVTTPDHAGVVLYYGQSGVGKSSLLDAGLSPRLEVTYAVSYARRDRSLGVLGTLRKQLASAVGRSLEANGGDSAQEAEAASIGETWLAAEQQLGKPLVLILDQVEEIFSRRNPDQPAELEEFAAALAAIDAGRSRRPAGVLLLAFRKERLAEIETALREERVDFAKQFLGPLDVEGIQEVFWGPVRNPRLAAKYGLTVEEGLPEIVAHDLTADPDSPVAPTFSILLRKLWANATAQSASAPYFSVDLYEKLRRDGILLDDFLRQQTATLAQEQPDSVTSGLLLDLWAFHTTPLGTSDQRDASELAAAYGQQPSLEALVLRSKELYVLADPPGDGAAPASGGTRLAHDTLAPLVRRDFATSALPGQQARRLLESRAIDWRDGRSGPLLDDAALAVIDKGLAGMRSLAGDEQRLLTASRKAQAERIRRRRLWQGAAAAAALIVVVLLGTSLYLWNNERLARAREEAAIANSQLQTERAVSAEERTRASQLSTQLANERERTATRDAQLNESRRLAQLAEQQLAVDPVVSLHLALAAVPEGPNQTVAPEAEYVLRQAVLASREREYITTTVDAPDQVAIDGNRVAIGGPAPAIYDVELNPQSLSLPPDFTNIQGLRWGDDDRLLGWSEDSVWVVGGGQPQQFPLQLQEGEQVRCAEWQPAQRWVAVCTYNSLYAWEPAAGRVITLTTELDTPDLPTEPRSAIWSRDGRWLAGLGARLIMWDSASPASAAAVFYTPSEPGHWVGFAFWLPDDRSLVTGWDTPLSDTPQFHIWRADAEDLETVALPGDLNLHLQINALFVPDPLSNEPRLLLWSADGLLALYDMEGRELAHAADVPLYMQQPVLSPDGTQVAGFAADGSAVVWFLPDLLGSRRLDRTNRFVASSLTSAAWLDNNTLVLGDSSGLLQVVRLDPLSSRIGITQLAGYGPGERLAQALRLANGRLLTASLFDGANSSLRIWQLDPLVVNGAEELLAASEPLCDRLHHSIALPGGLQIDRVERWEADGTLIAGAGEQVAHWQLGGDVHLLPADEELHYYELAPDGRWVLRYGNGTDGQIWQLDEDGWQQETVLPGPIVNAAWTEHGILVGYADETARLVDPAGGQRRPLPPDTVVNGSTMLSPDLLLAATPSAIVLWNLADNQEVASWPLPKAIRLTLDDESADRHVFVWRGPAFGELYVLAADAEQGTLTELWRSEAAALNRSPSTLHPSLPLLANVQNGSVTVVDLAQGQVLWRSTSVAAVVAHQFLRVQWSTDGLFLITQAQPPQPATFRESIGIWRWDDEARHPLLLQELPSSGLVAVSPDLKTVLALPGGAEPGGELLLHPVLADARQLRQDVPASCLLVRSLGEAQQQAFALGGRQP